jgi:Peptidase family M1 domain
MTFSLRGGNRDVHRSMEKVRLFIRRRFTLPMLLLAIARIGVAQQTYTRVANYSIDARLDTASHSIDAHEILNWHNTSGQPVSDLQFHLYANAFKSSGTTFMLEGKRSVSAGASGRIDLLNIVDLRTGEDLTGRIRYIQPDDGNLHDSTVISLQLSRPVAPRDSIGISIDFHERLPEAISRSGWAPGRQFYFVAQWFPKIGVFQNGTWNCHQFHAFTEFFADFGTYRVGITVPSGFKVGASGEMTGEPSDSAGNVTYNFVANEVHDFAWTASPDFLALNRTFKCAGLPETKVVLLLQPEHSGQADRYFAAVDTAIKYFGLWYGPYPYPVITVVDPPRTAHVGGMEYPTLITAGTDDYTLKDFLSPEAVTIHEFGHQYWYGMVANNEFEEAWLDEGMNSYSTGKVLEEAYGPNTSEYKIAGVYPVYLYPLAAVFDVPVAAIFGKVSIREPYNRLPNYLRNGMSDPISQYGFRTLDRGSYRAIAYDKPELVLRTLEGFLGPEVMGRVMKTYFEEFKFRHPTAADFENVCEQVSGEKLGWFFSQFIDGTGTVDFAVKSIDYFKETDLGSGASTYVTRILVARNGEVKMPVDLRLSLQDGSAIDTVWDGQSRWQTFTFRSGAPPDYAALDPSGKIPIDTDYANNSMTVRAYFTPVLKWFGRIVNYFQNILLNVGVLA